MFTRSKYLKANSIMMVWQSMSTTTPIFRWKQPQRAMRTWIPIPVRQCRVQKYYKFESASYLRIDLQVSSSPKTGEKK